MASAREAPTIGVLAWAFGAWVRRIRPVCQEPARNLIQGPCHGAVREGTNIGLGIFIVPSILFFFVSIEIIIFRVIILSRLLFLTPVFLCHWRWGWRVLSPCHFVF